MRTTIQRWGNSNAVRLPKPLLTQAALKEGDPVEMTVVDGGVLLTKATPGPTHKTLAERLQAAGWTDGYAAPEYDPSAVGEEVFW
ncbi:MAG: AbrB/MazE/SpoVT family DNA-binding domain-containing protein [Bifidobacteriaceae bacterium]|jgi:antitoxin MazE|nr:AbrB/MazE/SpoVT family DNA-binding domain-containing protein [Bifidobacteriaceae bacterium]